MLGLSGVRGCHAWRAEPQLSRPATELWGLCQPSILLWQGQSSQNIHGCTWGWHLSSSLHVCTQW